MISTGVLTRCYAVSARNKQVLSVCKFSTVRMVYVRVATLLASNSFKSVVHCAGRQNPRLWGEIVKYFLFRMPLAHRPVRKTTLWILRWRRQRSKQCHPSWGIYLKSSERRFSIKWRLWCLLCRPWRIKPIHSNSRFSECPRIFLVVVKIKVRISRATPTRWIAWLLKCPLLGR